LWWLIKPWRYSFSAKMPNDLSQGLAGGPHHQSADQIDQLHMRCQIPLGKLAADG
jgi:hypothetical protein